MTDQTRWGIPEVQLKNRARNYDKQKKLHQSFIRGKTKWNK